MTKSSLIAVLATLLLVGSVAEVRAQNGTVVVVVDIAEVFEKNERFKQRMDEIKKRIEQYDAQFRDRRKRIGEQVERLKEFAPNSVEYKSLETQLANQNASLNVDSQLKRKEILMEEARIYFEAYEEVVNHIRRFCETNGIGLVLAFDSKKIDPTKRDSVLKGVNRTVVYQRQLNITRHVLSSLNSGVAPRNASNPRTPAIPGQVR